MSGPREEPTGVRSPAPAVLLLDPASRTVVAVDRVARELAAPELPCPVQAWSAAAGLQPIADADPLHQLCTGQTLNGQLVRIGDADHWLSGFSIPGREPGAGALTLAVLVPGPNTDTDTDTEAEQRQVRDRAVVAAGLSFTISDARLPDDPLIFVNPAFERTTGYAPAEVMGRNCRFLQGPDTDPEAVERLRTVLREQRHESVTLLNYRKDGSAFWNEVSLSPVYDDSGALTHFVGIQADVTARVAVEFERQRHLQAERSARAEAEAAQNRLALLAEATSMLAATLDVGESLERLTSLVVPMLADFCTVHLLDPEGGVQRVVARHRDPDRQPLLRRLEELQPAGLGDGSHTAKVLHGGPPERLTIDEEVLAAAFDDPELSELYRALAPHEAMLLPLRARRQVLGVLSLFCDGSGREFSDADLDMAADLARRAAITVDNARLYEREHEVAEKLQRSLLPVLPIVPGIDRAARYLPGATAAQVGGDWYDLLGLPDGAVGIAVGDVMGHDLTAAASMGQLRSVLQSYAWQGSRPAVVLDRLDQLVQGLAMAQLATCVYGRLTLPTGDTPGRLVLASAGHLPPVLRAPDGSTRLLATSPDLLVGAALGSTRAETTETLPVGSVLVLYTDGLVEQRGRGIDEGIAELRAALADAPEGDAEAIADALLDALSDGALEDDVALLVVRVLEPEGG